MPFAFGTGSAHSVFNEPHLEKYLKDMPHFGFSHYRFDSFAYESTAAKMQTYKDMQRPVRVQTYAAVLSHFRRETDDTNTSHTRLVFPDKTRPSVFPRPGRKGHTLKPECARPCGG